MTRRISFDEWLAAVNDLVVAKAGIRVDDGADFPSARLYGEGATVKQGARSWAAYQDFPGLKKLFT